MNKPNPMHAYTVQFKCTVVIFKNGMGYQDKDGAVDVTSPEPLDTAAPEVIEEIKTFVYTDLCSKLQKNEFLLLNGFEVLSITTK